MEKYQFVSLWCMLLSLFFLLFELVAKTSGIAIGPAIVSLLLSFVTFVPALFRADKKEIDKIFKRKKGKPSDIADFPKGNGMMVGS